MSIIPITEFFPELMWSHPSILPGVTRDDTSSASGVIHPRMDLRSPKDSNEMVATFELPGLKKEDVEIDVHNNRLIVSGQSSTSQRTDTETEGWAVKERRYGRFSRTLPLSPGIKPEEIHARLEHGVLTVQFPKSKPEQEPKRIAVS